MTGSGACCGAPVAITPLTVENRPGLSAIAYRIGTYAAFREAMFEAISHPPRTEADGPVPPSLAALTTRDSDDYAVTLLELWAAVADVLTFYQQRHANEAFWRTATRAESLTRLARLIGYHPTPGVAALAWLAFTADAGKRATVPAGTRVQSIPAPPTPTPGAEPQAPAPVPPPETYETLAPAIVDSRLNRLRIYPKPELLAHYRGQSEMVLDRLEGAVQAASVHAGDAVVLFSPPAEETETAPTQPFAAGLADGMFRGGVVGDDLTILGHMVDFRRRLIDELTQTHLFPQPAVVEEKRVAAVRIVEDRVVLAWDGPVQGAWPAEGMCAYRLKRTFRLFGHNAPVRATVPLPDLGAPVPDWRTRWQTITLQSSDFGYPDGPLLGLDGRYEGLTVGGKLLVVSDTEATLVSVTQLAQASASFQGGSDVSLLSDTVTCVTVDTRLEGLNRQTARIYELVGDPLTFWPGKYHDTITDATVYLPGKLVSQAETAVEVGCVAAKGKLEPGVVLRAADLEIGRPIIVHDEADEPLLGTVGAAPSILPANAEEGQFCHLVLPLHFATPVQLDTDTAVLLGNVVRASHGETMKEDLVLPAQADRSFPLLPLKKKPVTYLPSEAAEGPTSSVEVRVNRVRWTEVPSLYGRAQEAMVYSLRTTEEGGTEVQFGDGKTGARPPSSAQITATYRVGGGLVGRVEAKALTTLRDRLPGLREVTNPLPSAGGADPESASHLREYAPRTVRTFHRAVSERDFEDCMTQSREVAKAQAVWVWDGYHRALHLTVAGQEGALFPPEELARLTTMLTNARAPHHRLRIDNYVRVPIIVWATVGVDPAYPPKYVVRAARQALLTAVSFPVLQLGRPLHLSHLQAALQEVEGVAFVDIDRLLFKYAADSTSHGVVQRADGSLEPVQGHLRIYPARPDPHHRGQVLPAELAWVEAPAVDVHVSPAGEV